MELIRNTDANNIIILGAWNRFIFSPEWVKKYLFDNRNDILINNIIDKEGFPKLTTEKFKIFVIGNKLNFVCTTDVDRDFNELQAISIKINEYLPHTPINAFGVNFQFIETNIKPLLDNQFKLCDDILFTGETINNTILKREIVFSKYILNFMVTIEKDKMKFDFNYHFNISDLIEFKEKLEENNIIELKKHALSILNKYQTN